MKKPQSLRVQLEQAFPYITQNPDRLLIFVDGGNVRSTLATGLSFEYSYDLNVLLTDFSGDMDGLSVVLLDWLRVNQSEILANLEKGKSAIKFEADILDNNKVDLSITLPLTERVIVNRDGDKLNLSHPEEPQYTPTFESTLMTLYDPNGEQLLQWQSGEKLDEYSLDMPWPKNHG